MGNVGRIYDTRHRPGLHGAPGNHPGRGPADDEIRSRHPPMEGSSGVFFPGERSAKTRQERLAQGIPVDPTTWAQVEALFDPYGVRDQLADVLPSGGHS